MRKYLLIGLLVYWFIGLLLPKAEAAMQGNNYTIEKKEIEIQPFRPPTPTSVQNNQEVKPAFSGKNYKAYANNSSYLELEASSDNINFGTLSATNPVTRMLDFTVKSTDSYQIFISEDHPLLDGKNTIPDTTCDSGSCSEITSSLWDSSLTYGLGYHTAALAENEYKQFPDLSKKEQFEAVFGDKITYKINISSAQAEGAYKNIVTYLATPSF